MHLKHFFQVIFMCAFIFVLSHQSYAGDQMKLVLTCTEGNQIHRLSTSILTEAYEKLGYSIDVKELPAERAAMTANSGEADGIVVRTKSSKKFFPNLIMVPAKVTQVDGVVLTKKSNNFVIEGWKSLKPYKIAYIHGCKWAEINTKGMNIYTVPRFTTLFHVLEGDRVDVIVLPRLVGQSIIENLKINDIKILEPPVITMELYHYLNKKQEHLSDKLAAVLREMDQSGRITEIREDFRSRLFAKK